MAGNIWNKNVEIIEINPNEIISNDQKGNESRKCIIN